MTPSDSAGPKIGGYVKTAHNYLLREPSYTVLKSPWAVMQIFKNWGIRMARF